MEPITFEYVKAEKIPQLAAMADEIWHEFFPGVISEAQIDYMVEKFQSQAAIEGQIAEQQYEYYFILCGGVPCGYTGLCPDGERLFLSKLYLKKEYRGRGIARQAFDFIRQSAVKRNLSAVYLTVNKHNTHSVEVYKHIGFRTIDTQAADIGAGFVMDDYIMQWTI